MISPILGPLAVAGPIIGALSGAAVGGVIGGLAGGTGALARIGIPEHDRARVEQKIGAGAILIAVESDESARLDRGFGLQIFRSRRSPLGGGSCSLNTRENHGASCGATYV